MAKFIGRRKGKIHAYRCLGNAAIQLAVNKIAKSSEHVAKRKGGDKEIEGFEKSFSS